jgi:hypothetical protein
MELITTDGKLTVEGMMIRQKRLTNAWRRNLIISAFFFLFILNVLIEKTDIALETGKTTKWISVGIFGFILLLYLAAALYLLFKQHWGRSLSIADIREIKTYESDEGLETVVRVTLKSGKYKAYTFRTLERQAGELLKVIQSNNPTVSSITE